MENECNRRRLKIAGRAAYRVGHEGLTYCSTKRKAQTVGGWVEGEETGTSMGLNRAVQCDPSTWLSSIVKIFRLSKQYVALLVNWRVRRTSISRTSSFDSFRFTDPDHTNALLILWLQFWFHSDVILLSIAISLRISFGSSWNHT